ncbi:MAG: hypothetical protein C0592_08680 [Marinilabiliales bacterium]|nr:MAG: hypothetical protein C0592_08680 [Marinilabiliales bacterium]
MKGIYFVLVMLISAQIFSQTKFKDPDDLVTRGVKYYENGNYSKAISLFDEVNKNDSLYPVAMYEKSMCLHAQEKIDEAVVLLEDIINTYHYKTLRSMVMLASLYDEQERYDEAQEIYEGLVAEHPYSQNAWYNLGVSYFLSEDYELAEQAFIKSILLKPWHPRSSIFLGLLNSLMNRPVHAIACINVAAWLNADNELGMAAVRELESVCEGAYDDEIVKDIECPDSITSDKIQELEPIISSHVITNKKLKMPTKNDYSFTKYNYVVFSELDDEFPNSNIYTSFYFPLVKSIYNEEYFDEYSYYILQNFNLSDVQKYVKKKKTKLIIFQKWSIRQFAHYIYETGFFHPKNVHYEYKDGEIYSIYTYSDSTKEILDGEYMTFHNTGVISSRGKYENDIPVEKAYVYDDEGKMIMEVEYEGNEDEDGLFKAYFENGELSHEIEIKDNVKNGYYKEYYPNGNLESNYYYKNDRFTGNGYELTIFGDTASILSECKEDTSLYQIRQYYSSGQLLKTQIRTKSDAEQEGVMTSYFMDGSIHSRSKVVDGEYVDTLVIYNVSGDTADFYVFDEDGETIIEKHYGSSGNLSTIVEYEKEDTYHNYEFHYNGAMLSDLYVKGDKYVSLIIYDTTGTEIQRLEDLNKGNNVFQTIDVVTGQVIIDYELKGGKHEGYYKVFTPSGSLLRTMMYEDDELHGEFFEYYPDGSIRIEKKFKNGELSGPYTEYYPDSTLEQTGYYLDDHRVGEWISYYPDGTKEESRYYNSRGERNGWIIHYVQDTIIDFMEHYESDKMVGYLSFDANGDTILYYEVVDGYLDADIKYDDGKNWKKFMYVDNVLVDSLVLWNINGTVVKEGYVSEDGYHGSLKYYYDDGTLDEEKEFLQGYQNGLRKRYFENGSLHSETPFLNDDYNGVMKKYFKNGKISSLTHFVDDNLNGNRDYYNPLGEFMVRLIYHNGYLKAYTYKGSNGKFVEPILVDKDTVNMVAYYPGGQKSFEATLIGNEWNGRRVYYYKNGSVFWEEYNHMGRSHGRDVSYWPDGSKMYDFNYEYGYLHGKALTFHKNGKLEREEEYYYGNKTGKENVYDKNGKLIEVRDYYLDVMTNQNTNP